MAKVLAGRAVRMRDSKMQELSAAGAVWCEVSRCLPRTRHCLKRERFCQPLDCIFGFALRNCSSNGPSLILPIQLVLFRFEFSNSLLYSRGQQPHRLALQRHRMLA